ncbi:MAG: hypothetical protein ACRDRX_15505 [Pseudonocardiaceae bacterium]
MSAADLHLLHHSPGLGVGPGESDPAGMLGGVLLLLAVVTLMGVLALMWWLA